MQELSQAEIRGQLSQMLSDGSLSNAPSLAKFLAFITEETLSGRDQGLKGYAIALEVFGRNKDFDAQNDTIVRVQAGKLRQKIKRYYETTGLHDRILITLPKGGYVPHFERRSNGVVHKDRQFDHQLSVAVLPFTNLSDESLHDAFCDGISEEIITALSRFSEFTLSARSVSFQYGGRNQNLVDLGNQLQVSYILTGSVRQSGDKIRVTTELVNTIDGTQVWSESYDRKYSAADLFEIQDEISKRVAIAIATPNGVILEAETLKSRSRTVQQLAFRDAILSGYAYLDDLTDEKHLKTRTELREAVRVEPNHSDAWAILSLVYIDQERFSYNPEPDVPNPLDEALDAAQRAVSLSGSSSFAWHHLARTHFERREYELFKQAAERSILLNPNNTHALASLALMQWRLGNFDIAVEQAKKALDLSTNPMTWYYLVLMNESYRTNDLEMALEYSYKMNFPNHFIFRCVQTAIFAMSDKMTEAQTSLRALRKMRPEIDSTFRDEMRNVHFPDEFTDKLLVGLKRAGLKQV